jgi:hypothetical protein
MSNKEKLSGILHDIDEVKEFIEYLQDINDEIGRLEIDLALSKLREVYHELYTLVRHKQSPPTIEQQAEQTTVTKKIEEEHEHQPEESNITNQEKPVEDTETETNKKETLKEEPGQIMADKLKKEDEESLGDSLAKKQKPDDVSKKLQSQPIDDLSKYIGINDRFLYTKELFNGNRARFMETINKLNNANNYEAAESCLQEELGNKINNQYAKSLLELVKRKHNY